MFGTLSGEDLYVTVLHWALEVGLVRPHAESANH